MASPVAETDTGFRGAWSHRQWRLLITSFAVAATGEWLYGVGFLAWLLERTGSAGWLGAAELARILPAALLGSLAGVLADRWDRRRLLVGVDLARAGLMLVFALVIHLDGAPAVAIGLVAVNSLFTTAYRPAIVATTPQVVDERSLAAANAAESIVSEVSWFLGPALGALVLVVASAEWALVLNAVAYLASASILVRLRIPTDGLAVERSEDVASDSFAGELREGVDVVRGRPDLLVVIGLSVAVLFAFGCEQVLHVLVASERLGIGAKGLGWMTAAIAVGGLAVAPFTMRIVNSGHTGEFMGIAAVFLGAPLALLAVIDNVWVALAVLVVEGAAAITVEVLLITTLQRLAPRRALGRVLGLQDSAGAAANVLAALLAPFLVATASLEVALVVGGGVLVVYAIVALPALAGVGRRAERAWARFEPRVEVLASLPLLDGAVPEVLERIAASIVPERIAAGAVLLVQGDPADDLFVVRGGALDVLVDGLKVNAVVPGEVVGELGVLNRRPRSATVIATEPTDLWRIAGRAFLAAIESHPITPDALRRGAAERVTLANAAELG